MVKLCWVWSKRKEEYHRRLRIAPSFFFYQTTSPWLIYLRDGVAKLFRYAWSTEGHARCVGGGNRSTKEYYASPYLLLGFYFCMTGWIGITRLILCLKYWKLRCVGRGSKTNEEYYRRPKHLYHPPPSPPSTHTQTNVGSWGRHGCSQQWRTRRWWRESNKGEPVISSNQRRASIISKFPDVLILYKKK